MADLANWNAAIGYDWVEIAPGIQARMPRPLGGGNGSAKVVLELRDSPGEAGATASVHPVAPDGGVTVHYRAVAQQMHRHAMRDRGTQG